MIILEIINLLNCDSGMNMQELAKGSRVLPGKRFKNTVSSGELKEWAASELAKEV